MPDHDPDPNCKPDPNCEDCKGTGKITLARSVVDCGCRAPDAPAEEENSAILRELLDQLRGLGPGGVATSWPTPPVSLDFDGPGGPIPRSGP